LKKPNTVETKTFTTAHVLSIITGIGMVPEPDTHLPLVDFLLSYLASDDRYSQEQIEFCVDQLKRQLPQFAEANFQNEVSDFIREFELVESDRKRSEECALKWANKWIMRHGPTFEIMKPTDAPPPPPEPRAKTYAIQEGNVLVVGRVIRT
jgi:hypothetical protein